ncbi:hypothetical protein [Aminobacter sp. MSH1]|uniref:hypothetical protein n=1 Tax=Aminobacter sp. MSH1 TaxID=374606 RepID=UPI000D3355FD|nr:hypothetical protein [Aminobacter sp. MSH1]
MNEVGLCCGSNRTGSALPKQGSRLPAETRQLTTSAAHYLQYGKESEMRLLLFIIFAAGVLAATGVGPAPVSPAQAQECSGENCPQPSGQGSGRDCESKKENTVS